MKPNYKNACIYKLCCKDPTIKECYVGSTTNFRGRKYSHKSNCNNEKSNKYNRYVYKFIRDNGGFENWTMIELEKVDCNDCKTLHNKEREWFEKLQASLNKNIPTRTEKEWRKDNKEKIKNYCKKQYEDNKEKMKEYRKEYYQNNKEEEKRKRKLTTICMCGKEINWAHRKRHIKSNKHKKLMKLFIKNF